MIQFQKLYGGIMKINDIFNEMNFDSRIELEEMPELDLYMDQVIQLF